VHLRQRLSEREAQPGARIVASQFLLDLLERARKARQVLRRDAAAGIDDTQRQRVRRAARMHHDRARVGELDRVGQEIEQNLFHRAMVGFDFRQMLGVDDDGKAFFLRLAFGEAHRLFDRDGGVQRAR